MLLTESVASVNERQNLTGRNRPCCPFSWDFFLLITLSFVLNLCHKLWLSYSSAQQAQPFAACAAPLLVSSASSLPDWHLKILLALGRVLLQQDLCEQCCQVSSLFASGALPDMQIRLCKACHCNCWRQSAAGHAAGRTSFKGGGFECVLISNDLLVCFATLLALISFLLASLILSRSQSLLLSVSCRVGPNRSSALAQKMTAAA